MQKFHLIEKWLIRSFVSALLILFGSISVGNAYSAPKTVLVLGDSLSAEFGLKQGSGWVALMEQRIKKHNLNVNVINASISGETTSGGLERINALLTKHRPTTVIIELGANDGLRGLTLGSTENNFISIISNIKSAKASVLLVGMRLPPNYGPTYTRDFAAMYENVANTTKVPLVPFLLEGVADKPDFFQADKLHLTAAAHPAMLDNVWPYLLPLISP